MDPNVEEEVLQEVVEDHHIVVITKEVVIIGQEASSTIEVLISLEESMYQEAVVEDTIHTLMLHKRHTLTKRIDKKVRKRVKRVSHLLARNHHVEVVSLKVNRNNVEKDEHNVLVINSCKMDANLSDETRTQEQLKQELAEIEQEIKLKQFTVDEASRFNDIVMVSKTVDEIKWLKEEKQSIEDAINA
jgi:hypothetical protein